MSMPRPSPPPVDVQALRPGHRIRIRDWRDGRLYDGTVFAHVYGGGARVAIFPVAIPPRRRPARLSVFRDHFVDERIIAPSDVVEHLPTPSDEERGRWMARVLEADASRCPGCMAFLVDRRQDVGHGQACKNVVLVHELTDIMTRLDGARSL
jgi:hypothetical protein